MKIRIRIQVVGLTLLVTAPLVFSAMKPSPVQRAPAAAALRTNPYDGRPQANQAGAKLFRRECAECHGAAGRGFVTKAPPLASQSVRDAAPGALFWVLRNGSIYRGMPSFSHLPEQQRWQIVTYLKQLQQPNSPEHPTDER
jgi:mono/diheme cytochrome c family protein